jgi:hypothetical protein
MTAKAKIATSQPSCGRRQRSSTAMKTVLPSSVALNVTTTSSPTV